MKIAMLASESNPFAKTGGLADVVYSLSVELAKKKNEVAVVMPLYRSLWDKKDFAPILVTTFPVYMGWRRQQADIYRMERDGVVFYFIANAYYFDREKLYGFGDDGERFAFFSLAFIEMLKRIQFCPDIVHVHDWQAAIVPCLIKERYKEDGFYRDIRFVLSIHNPAFKGYLYPDALPDLFGLSEDLFYYGQVRLDDMVSTLKAGIMYADKISTVSPTHRSELLQSWLGHHLEGALRLREWDFTGIVNGIDVKEWDPLHDKDIPVHYSKATFAKKKENRPFLCEKLSIPCPEGPIFGVVSRLTDQKGMELVFESFEQRIAPQGGALVVLGAGDPHLEWRLQNLRDRYPNQVGIYIGYNEQIAHLIYAGSDFFLMPSLFEPCGISQMIAQRYGTPPVVRRTGGLADTVHSPLDSDKPDGIVFNDFDVGGLNYGIDVSFSYYRDPKAYDVMALNAMSCDHSWKESAALYLGLYKAAIKR